MNLASISVRKASRLALSLIRPLLSMVAISSSVMSDTASPSSRCGVSWIAARALLEILPGSRASQITTWVSNRITGIAHQNCLQKLAPLFRRQRRRNHVARDAAFAAEKTENLVGVSLDGHQLRHRLAMFRDHHGLALVLDLVHDGETVGFECSCGNGFHSITRGQSFRLWSLYHSHSRVFDREGTSFTQPALSEVEGCRFQGKE